METKDLKSLIEEATKIVEESKELTDEELQKLEEFQEAMSMSMVQRSREAKINAAVGAIAVHIAKEKNDPLVHKMMKFRKLWKENKEMIMKKYGALAYQKWVQKQASK